MRPTLTTRAPAVVDGLLELLRAAPVFEWVQVLDGPALSMADVERDSIAVAPGTEDQAGVMCTYDQQPGLGNAYVEQVEVVVALASHRGDVDMKASRDRVSELLAGLQEVLRANRTRAGAWDQIGFGPEVVWHPVQSTAGATCAVGITVVARSVI